MAFLNVRLPVHVEQGAKGGPGFLTTVNGLQSGEEQRNIEWSQQRCEFDVSYGVDTKQTYNTIRAFFYAMRGKAHGFRFKDWGDYEVEEGLIGVGDDATFEFQLTKRYTVDSETFTRIIKKPVQGTVHIFADGVELIEETDYSVDYDTGNVVFIASAPPTTGVVITATFEFDVPVRFDTDRLAIILKWEHAGSVPAIPLVEVRR